MIDALIIIAPKGGHRNWLKYEGGQVSTHLPEELCERSTRFTWNTNKVRTIAHKEGVKELIDSDFAILGMTYSSALTSAGAAYLRAFLKKRRALLVLDESPQIKTPGSKRTKFFQSIGPKAAARRILTGMPAEESPFDLYSQIRFLDQTAWHSLGIRTAAAFRSHFGIWEDRYTNAQGGRVYKSLVEYKNIKLLNQIMNSYGSRVLKSDVLDLPEKLYSRRFFDMTPKQSKIYHELEREYETEFDHGTLTTELAITRMLRMQQVTSGYLPTDDDTTLFSIEEKNPRIELLMDTLEEAAHGQVLVWAKYRQDINLITREMDRRKLTYGRYDGMCSDDALSAAERRFHEGDIQYLVLNPEVGGEILTLNEANVSVYHNNSFRLKHRKQSEDRNHRIGQDDKVLYVDLAAEGTIDEYIVDSLVAKSEVTAATMGDTIKPWL